MRSTLSPAFTSSKIRLMVPFMEEAGNQMIAALMKKTAETGGPIQVECKDLTSRYANDVIASCAFGLKRLKLTLFSKDTTNFFISLVLDTMKNREENNIIRPDMIHLLMEAKKEWSDTDLVAQAVLFFIGGFETISIGMSFTLYELALHPEVQERLAQEIKETHSKSEGKLDFDLIQNMQYLDMVISEVLRLWPPGILLDRICCKDYNMGKPNKHEKRDFILRKGDLIAIPVFSIHRDAKYFPDPEKFNPERFSDENKHLINSMTYMPFGFGPRNCIGSRFALLEIKMLIYQVLLRMEVSPCEKTCIPSKLSPETTNLKLRLKLTLFSKDTTNFFISLVLDTMKNREENNIIRPDMIHLLMEAKKVGMSFALHELALHPEVQERLAQEIKDTHERSKGKLDFNLIQNMQYMDMVVSEVLRLWPPGISLDRLCCKDYNMGKPNKYENRDFILRKGDLVAIPMFSIHRDAKYFPDPEKFDPERFSDENKHLIKSMTYMPFGSRFALLELKMLIYQIILHMEVSPCEKTCIPSKLSVESVNLRLVGDHWLNFKIRQFEIIYMNLVLYIYFYIVPIYKFNLLEQLLHKVVIYFIKSLTFK
ncbi:unnamed protein product, partial [Leptidea sinapis]